MISVRFGGCVYGPGVFMFESEAAEVKDELLARHTVRASKLAAEIGIPGDGTVYAGDTRHDALRKVATRLRMLSRDIMSPEQAAWLDETQRIAEEALK